MTRPETPAERAARRVRLAGLRAVVEEETRRLGKRRVQLGNIEQERRLQTESLDDVKRRLEQIDVEAGVHGRISVASHGDRPVEAESDRRLPLSLLGGLGGLGLGFALVAFRGIREGRLRYVTDVDGGAGLGRFLGVVPDLAPGAASDAAPASGAAGGRPLDPGLAEFCIHHVRTMLQVQSGGRRPVIALTSPSAGAGKTMLVLALGRSFAASGARTLLVDCDFIGHGLSATMRGIVCDDATRALAPDATPDTQGGDVRSGRDGRDNRNGRDGRNGRDDREDGGRARSPTTPVAFADSSRVEWLLDEAEARRDGGESGLSGTIRRLGLVAGAPGGDAEAGRTLGVLGVLHGRPVGECVLASGTRGLDVLPVGEPGQRSAERLSQASVTRLFAACRAAYDVVLVDTGPVLGSLEAVFVAVASDGVVVVVPRGDRRRAVEETLARLDLLGASVSGVVFNRASAADVAASSYASRSASRPAVA